MHHFHPLPSYYILPFPLPPSSHSAMASLSLLQALAQQQQAATFSRQKFVPIASHGTNRISAPLQKISIKDEGAHRMQPLSVSASLPCKATTISFPELVEENVDFNEIAMDLLEASPLEIMDKALSMFGNDIAIAFSGAEDVALVEYAKLTGRPFRVFSLDTGRLNPETYQFFAEVEKHYNIHIEYMFPEAEEVQALVRSKGLFSFYEDGHQECCRIRKVKPLRKALKGLRAWITGQRKDQSPGTRANVPVAQVDPSFEGLDGGVGSLIKWNPLANVQGNDVWKFLQTMNVPVNTLHYKGYVSIGCEPCTRPVLPGQHEREGRWWWEDSKAKECGLHKGNIENTHADNKNSVQVANGAGDIFSNKNVLRLTREGIERLASLEERKESWLVVLYAPWCPFCQAAQLRFFSPLVHVLNVETPTRDRKFSISMLHSRKNSRAMEESYNEVAFALRESGVKVAKFRADGEHKSFSQQHLQLETFPTILLFPKHISKAIKYPSEKRDAHSLLAFVKSLQ